MDVLRSQKRLRVDCVNDGSKRGRPEGPILSSAALSELGNKDARLSENSDTIRRLSSGDVPEAPAPWGSVGPTLVRSSVSGQLALRSDKGPAMGGLASVTPGVASHSNSPGVQLDLQESLLSLQHQEQALLNALRQARRSYDLRVARILSGFPVPTNENIEQEPSKASGIYEGDILTSSLGFYDQYYDPARSNPLPASRAMHQHALAAADRARQHERQQAAHKHGAGGAGAMAPPPPRPPRIPAPVHGHQQQRHHHHQHHHRHQQEQQQHQTTTTTAPMATSKPQPLQPQQGLQPSARTPAGDGLGPGGPLHQEASVREAPQDLRR